MLSNYVSKITTETLRKYLNSQILFVAGDEVNADSIKCDGIRNWFDGNQVGYLNKFFIYPGDVQKLWWIAYNTDVVKVRIINGNRWSHFGTFVSGWREAIKSDINKVDSK